MKDAPGCRALITTAAERLPALLRRVGQQPHVSSGVFGSAYRARPNASDRRRKKSGEAKRLKGTNLMQHTDLAEQRATLRTLPKISCPNFRAA